MRRASPGHSKRPRRAGVAVDVGLEFLAGELKGSLDPSGIVFTVLAAMSGMEREYILDRASKDTSPPASAARPSAAPGVTDEDMLSMALHLRDIAKRLVITTGAKKGRARRAGHSGERFGHPATLRQVSEPGLQGLSRSPVSTTCS